MMNRLQLLSFGALALIAGCTTRNTTNPARSATEEMLISTAADRAADRLALNIPYGSKVWVDSSNFDGTDIKYATVAVHTALLKRHADLVVDRKSADVVVEARSGALSTDQQNFLIGIPAFNIPVPFASGTLPFPELALYADNDQKGVAKFALTGFNAKTGALIDAQDPQYGFADNEHKILLFVISWSKTDAIPEDERYHPEDGEHGASLSSDQPANASGTGMATNK